MLLILLGQTVMAELRAVFWRHYVFPSSMNHSDHGETERLQTSAFSLTMTQLTYREEFSAFIHRESFASHIRLISSKERREI
jgi:hypothetical protein